jgi:hypothetical protein
MTSDEIIENLRLKAYFWRNEAATRFAGRPEADVCLAHARHAETLAELERLKALDDVAGKRHRLFACRRC